MRRLALILICVLGLTGCEIEYRRSPRKSEIELVSPDRDLVAHGGDCACDPPCAASERCYSGTCKPIAVQPFDPA